MSYQDDIEMLESEWSPDDGFFWRIRRGHFSAEELQRALQRVSTLSIVEDAELPRRLVSLLWYIPLFMHWQMERIQEASGDTPAYTKAITAMTNEIERLLGVP